MSDDNGASVPDQALVQAPSPDGLGPTGFDPSRGLFNYTHAQHYNIHMKLHPDCCQATVCTFCGASEDNLLPCAGDLTGLALEIFEEASCSARNANVKSIGQFTNWQMHDRHARAFDAAARFIAAQGMSTRSAETEGLSPQDASPVGSADAPKASPDPRDDGEK